MARTLKQLLQEMAKRGASDLHIVPGSPPMIRIDGRLTPLNDGEAMTAEEAQAVCYECLTQDEIMRFETERSLDLSFGMEGIARFRANIYWSLESIAGAFRAIPYQIPAPTTLGIPPAVVRLIDRPRGLILVTGPTGSGKSTTLAALLDTINANRAEHIVTIEDPVEYLHLPKKSIINQREIGRDAPTFVSALKYILRQDPNVVLIGEMRDLETIAAAVTIAETGHLVLATLHTNSAVQTIDRIVDVFPPHQQSQIRTQLSFILEGILCQQLVPKIGGGRALALELLVPNAAIRNLIREGKTHQLPSQMLMGQGQSEMVTLDQSLARLVKSGTVKKEDALFRAAAPEEFLRLL